jgi:TetR/AcrR family transcriptional regulator
MNWQRARTDEQKEQRIDAILEATARLYEQSGFEEITLAAIAREANFTRSNLYKYFRSKEEIFFEFLKHDVRLWRKDLVAAFEGPVTCSADEFAAVWVEVLTGHQRLLRLISVMYAHLEKKSSFEGLLDFKQMANSEFGLLSDMLCQIFPDLDPGRALKFLQLQLAMSIGLYTMTDLSKTQQKVLDRPEFQHFKIEFAASLQEAVGYLLKGLLK